MDQAHIYIGKHALVCGLLASTCLLLVAHGHQPSTYRLVSSATSYAQYAAWYPCLNGTILFEFKTSEPNGILFYAQSLPYKYIQLSLAEGHLRMRMRIGEKDNPRGVFLVTQTDKLSDNTWHQVKITRANERTSLTVDNEHLYHDHKDASLEGLDLHFGAFSASSTNDLLVFGGFPGQLQTYDLALGTALFESRYDGFIRNVRALNCSYPYLARLDVIASANLEFSSADVDPCVSNPCRNRGVCSVVSNVSAFVCDCAFTAYEGVLCDKVRPPAASSELTFNGRDYFSFEIPNGNSFATTYEEEFSIDFKTSRSTGLLAYAGDTHDYFVCGIQDGGLFVKLNIKGTN